ncbi:MAG: hypothetical protein KC420_11715, partial [Myxococcales bacterium]|nr:hypothetical protein [Myxococcales bacterium]
MSAGIDLEELAKRESAQVEWKEGVADWHDVVENCVAFANDYHNLGGGYVVCGAAERKDAYGFPRVEMVGLAASDFKRIQGRVLDACNRNVSPPLAPLIQEIETADPARRVLVFIQPATRDAHSYRKESRASGDYFVRLDGRVIVAQNGLLRELLVRKQVLSPWDEREATSATSAAIDPLAVRAFLQKIGLWNSARSIEDFLNEPLSALAPVLGRIEPLSRELRPTHAAILMFGEAPQRLIPSAVAVFSIYPGIDRGESHAERHEIGGTIFAQVEQLFALLATENYGVTDKRSAEANISKYPKRALHEAVINALVHRDYEDREPVRVTVFSDRIEIYSPGGLPTGVDAEAFKAGTATPRWRNRSLAYFFNRLHLAQSEGQGIPTILREMRSGGSPDPTFLLGERSVTCVLPAHPRHAAMRELREIEREVMLGNSDSAGERLRELLGRDAYNERALELFCDVFILNHDPDGLAAWLRESRVILSRLGASTQVALAEALGQDATESAERQELIDELQALAAEGHLHEDHALRLVASLRRSGQH